MQARKDKLYELQTIISKMPLEVCSVEALPEFGVRWREVSIAVKNARLPMQPSSVARVLCQHAAKVLPPDELHEIIGRLRLKLAATQSRTWHVIHLEDPVVEESVAEMIQSLPHRLLAALRKINFKNSKAEVLSIPLGSLVYTSVRFLRADNASRALLMASPPDCPIALLSTLPRHKIIKACAEGLGYDSYSIADLTGRDIPSLLRIADPAWAGHADHLAAPPVYDPTPTILANGIDFTNKTYDEKYVESIIGPDPPLLTDLNIKTTRGFFDKSLLNKTFNMTMSLKSENVAKTLCNWVVKGAITPTSDFFQIFHKIKSNKINYEKEDSE